MIKLTLLRYNFNFSYKDLSGMLWEYPIVIETVDSRKSDAEAYRKAIESFGHTLILKMDFIAPETLTVKVHKEIVKEVTLDDPEKTDLSRD